MISINNVEKAKKMIRECKDKTIILESQNDIFNRKMIEYGKFEVIVGIEKGDRKDSLRQIDSGFNHIVARDAAKNNISIGINFEELRRENNKEKAMLIARIKQNIKISRKAGVKLKAFNYKDRRDALAFLENIGASSKQIKEAIK